MLHHPTRVCAIPERPLTALATLQPQPQQHPPGAVNGFAHANGGGGGGCVLILSATAERLDLWRLPPAHTGPHVSLSPSVAINERVTETVPKMLGLLCLPAGAHHSP